MSNQETDRSGPVSPGSSPTIETEGPGLPPPRGPWKMLWIRLRKNKMAITGGSILLCLYFTACFAGFLSPYDFNEVNTDTTKYGPMLFGGPVIEQIGTHLVEIENEDYEWVEVEKPEYQTRWSWFNGGLSFYDNEGNFTLRPHVYALREYVSYDEYGETAFLLAPDHDVKLPIRFFVGSDETFEVASLCGFFKVFGSTKLFGVDRPEEWNTDAEADSDPADGGRHAEVFLLGSDQNGRDLLTRILFGGQISLSVGLLGIFISMSIGLVFGGVSGYSGGAVDFTMMRVTELLMAIPGLYLILTLRYVIPDDLNSRQTYLMIVAILALAGWAATGRVVRGMVLSLKENEYALAARALGAPDRRVILRHILPNTASFVIVTATLYVPYYILGEVSLSFLGLGITEPDTSWGLLLRDANNSQAVKYQPWTIIPGMFIFVAVLAYNFLGDGLRDAADPRAVFAKKK